jgi:sugar phosphate isomerase/epimerase
VHDARRIRIGNQTDWSASAPMDPFEYAVSRGFDAFEWFPDKKPDGRGWMETDLSVATRAWIRRVARAHDISLSVHGSWHASPLTAGGRDQLASQAEFAAEIGAAVFVTHLVTSDGLDQFADAVGPLVAGLVRAGIRLAVENTPESSASDINELFRCVRRRAMQDAVGLCLDVGHANLCVATRNDYLAYVDRLGPETAILHVHLHENWGEEDTHLALFTGPAAIDAAGIKALVDHLARRRFAGCIILEQWPQPPDLLDVARDRLAGIVAASTRVPS